MSNVELLPCPFCGSEAEILIHRINSELIVEEVRCVDCFVSRSWRERPNNNLHRAINAWNTRHQIPCETCSQMDNPDSFIFHLMQANAWELKEVVRRIESEVLDTLSDNGDDWFASSKVYDAIEIIKEYIENQ